MKPLILDSLTAAQRAAVEHVDGPLLILAGPGSGKTRVVTHRIAHMLQLGIHPGNLLALTFTNKAADEMRERVGRLVPGTDVWIGTFHRFCSRLLRRYATYVGLQPNFTIYDVADSRQALKRALLTLDLTKTMSSPEKIAQQISWLKNHLITPEEFEQRDGHALSGLVQEVYPAYQRELLVANAVDFDDLLLHTVTLLRQSDELRASLDRTFRYVMVDEYQDTNLAQYAIVRALSNLYPNLAVTGDPDQSIYGWRGANLSNILDFEVDYPNVQVIRLEQNYRSTPEILRVAQALISNNVRRKPKSLFTENAAGEPVRLAIYSAHTDEAEAIVAEIAAEVRANKRRARDFAIFYRINALSRTLEHALRGQGLAYQIVNGVEFYQRKEIKDVMAYLHLVFNPHDNSAFARIINVPPRRLGKTTLDRLAQYASQAGMPLLEAARRADTVPDLARVARGRLQDFAGMIDRLAQRMSGSVEELLGLILDETGYLRELRDASTMEDEERAANVEELLAEAREFDAANDQEDPLGAFLERAALVNDVDGWDEQTDRVTLMTLHAAKGLEFPVVYIIGVEHGLLPHERCIGVPEQEEEERRLLFVGITRAQQRLQLSHVLIRAQRGGLSHTIPSNFLMELPRAEMEICDRAKRTLTRGDVFAEPEYHDVDEAHDHDSDGDVWRPRHVERARSVSPDAAYGDQTGGVAPSSGPSASAGAPLRTAAQLLRTEQNPHSEPGLSGKPLPAGSSAQGSKGEPTGIDPDRFQIGMAVIHPTYGLGKVAALSGQGKDRTGTINFATAGQKKFVLSKSPLRPAR